MVYDQRVLSIYRSVQERCWKVYKATRSLRQTYGRSFQVHYLPASLASCMSL